MTILIVGGGIVGLATARELVGRGHPVTVLEAEERIAAHQTGHNSGVIHSGLYYLPGSAKARLCTEGRDAMYRFCEEEGIAHRRTGKLVVARTAEESARLDELERRGRANGLDGMERLDSRDGAALAERFPAMAGADSALWVPQTGIVDYREVAAVLARKVTEGGGEVRTGARVVAIEAEGSGGGDPVADRVRVRLAGGEELVGTFLVNCAGLQSDRVARLGRDRLRVGGDGWLNLRIVPFRGEYRELPAGAPLDESGAGRFPIYPVPDPRFPFLGVHTTPSLDGPVEAGPNAVLALHRHGYRRPDPLAVSVLREPRDLVGTLTFPGFWRLALRHWRFGLGEIARSWSDRLFRRELARLAPALGRVDGVRPGHSGVRAQAVDRKGNLVDDFRFVHRERQVHVLNAPSPAATASLAIGRHIADRVEGRLDGWEDEEDDV
jgi:L-2-hydroxyglutarate oxidase